MRLIKTVAIVGTAALTFVLGSCSSSGSDNTATKANTIDTTHATTATTTSSAATKDGFVAEAKAVCDRSNASLGTAAKTAFGSSQPDDATWQKFMVDKSLPIVTDRLDAIAALSAPPSDKATIAAIVDAGRSAVVQAKQHPEVLSPATRAPFDHFDELASAYGLDSCAVGG